MTVRRAPLRLASASSLPTPVARPRIEAIDTTGARLMRTSASGSCCRPVGPGAAGSWSLANLGPRIIANNFDPGFFVEHFIKDMGIALDESKRMGLAMPGLALAHQLYVSLKAQGHGRDGTHALELALSRMAGFDWKGRK